MYSQNHQDHHHHHRRMVDDEEDAGYFHLQGSALSATFAHLATDALFCCLVLVSIFDAQKEEDSLLNEEEVQVYALPVLLYLGLSILMNLAVLASFRQKRVFLTFSVGKALLLPLSCGAQFYLVFWSGDNKVVFGEMWITLVCALWAYNGLSIFVLWTHWTLARELSSPKEEDGLRYLDPLERFYVEKTAALHAHYKRSSGHYWDCEEEEMMDNYEDEVKCFGDAFLNPGFLEDDDEERRRPTRVWTVEEGVERVLSQINLPLELKDYHISSNFQISL